MQDTPEQMRCYVEVLSQRRYPILVALALLMLICSAGAARLQLASNYEIYFDHADPRLDALNGLHRMFSRNDNVLFALVPADGQVFSPRGLAEVGELTRLAWQLPYATRVDSITNFQHVSSDEDGVVIRDLVPEPDRVGAATARQVRALALAEPALVGRLVNREGWVSGVNVRLELPGNSRTAIVEAAKAARDLAKRIQTRNPDLRVYLTGNAMLNAAFPEASLYDLTHLVPLMFIAIVLGMWALLRSLRCALMTMVVVATAALIAMGLAGWMGIVVSSASVVAPTIIATVAIADCMHLFASYLRLRAAGQCTRACVESALAGNLKPVIVTSLTTAVGFISLNFSDAPPFRDLGNITAIGVLGALVLSLSVLPLLLLMAPPRGTRPPALDMTGFSRWVLANRRAALLCVLGLAGAAALALPRMELNDAFVEYFDQRIAFRRHTDFVMQNLTGIYQVEFAVRSAEDESGINDPTYLDRLDAFSAWLNRQPEVVHVSSITDVLKRLNQHVGDGRFALPGERELAAQFLLLYEMSIPFGLDLNDRVDVQRSASRVTATLRNLDNKTLRAFEERTQAWLEANVPPAMRAPPVGAAVMFAYIAQRNIQAMLQGTALAIVLIAGLLGLMFRSLRLGALSLLPNLVPAVIAFGAWAVLVGQMGVALAVVAAMSLGVVVDDTVHFTARFLQARRHFGMDAPQSVHHAFETTGAALASTSLVLALGFGVLSMSAFEINHGMGQLTALVVLCALLADFLMLPALLIAAANRGWA